MNLDEARRSYQHDAMFRRVVDTIESWIVAMNVTPAEARSAAMLAAIHVVSRAAALGVEPCQLAFHERTRTLPRTLRKRRALVDVTNLEKSSARTGRSAKGP